MQSLPCDNLCQQSRKSQSGSPEGGSLPLPPPPRPEEFGYRLLRRGAVKRNGMGEKLARVRSELLQAGERAQVEEVRQGERVPASAPLARAGASQVPASCLARAAGPRIGRFAWGDIRRWGGSSARKGQGGRSPGASSPCPVPLLPQAQLGKPVSNQAQLLPSG